jgi:hypothetical protein
MRGLEPKELYERKCTTQNPYSLLLIDLLQKKQNHKYEGMTSRPGTNFLSIVLGPFSFLEIKKD